MFEAIRLASLIASSTVDSKETVSVT